MNIKKLNILSDIINKEIITNNILFTFALNKFKVQPLCIFHTYSLYQTTRLLAAYGINMEVDEPQYIMLNTTEIKKFCCNSINIYSDYLDLEDCDTTLKKYLHNFIKTKQDILMLINNEPDYALSRQSNIGIQELSKFNGKNGNPSYVAVDGIIYDVSNALTWQNAVHFSLTPGKDLSSEFNTCHGDKTILSKLPIVGKLEV